MSRHVTFVSVCIVENSVLIDKMRQKLQTLLKQHSFFTRWMDTGTDDRQLIRELLPLSRHPINEEPPTKYLRMSGNTWFII